MRSIIFSFDGLLSSKFITYRLSLQNTQINISSLLVPVYCHFKCSANYGEREREDQVDDDREEEFLLHSITHWIILRSLKKGVEEVASMRVNKMNLFHPLTFQFGISKNI